MSCVAACNCTCSLLCSLMTLLLRTLSLVVTKHLLMLTAHKLNLLGLLFSILQSIAISCNDGRSLRWRRSVSSGFTGSHELLQWAVGW